jgi:hypothetical protein
MDFLERYFESLSPRSARALIAHELAHVYLHAVGDGEAAATVRDETRAYELEIEWGFAVGGLRAEKAWLQAPYVPKLFWKLYEAVGSAVASRTRKRR